jgi:hypothetical protein
MKDTTNTVYAHAIAPVIHMAFLRVGRKGDCPDIQHIREKILHNFISSPSRHSIEEVLRADNHLVSTTLLPQGG